MEEDKDYKHILRIANTDLNGAISIFRSLRQINGIDFMIDINFSRADCGIIPKVSGHLRTAENICTIPDEEPLSCDQVSL